MAWLHFDNDRLPSREAFIVTDSGVCTATHRVTEPRMSSRAARRVSLPTAPALMPGSSTRPSQ